MSWFHSIPAERLSAQEARRVCIIKPSAFGDIVQTLPVLSALRLRFPQARLAWVVKRQWADLIDGHPALDELLAFDTRRGFAGGLSFLRELRTREFDLVLDLQGLFRSAVMTWATRAAIRVGLQTAREGANLACNCVLPETGRLVPAHLRYRRVAEAVAPGVNGFDARLPVKAEHLQWARDRLGDEPVLRVAIHVGAAWTTKRWPVEKFAVVANRVLEHYNARVVLVGGPGDFAEGARLMESLGERRRERALDLIGQSNLKQLGGLLAHVDLLISNDSGPMHLAAAVGTPVLGIFTCTDPVRSGPAGTMHELVSTRVDCRASYRKRCPYRGERKMACHAELDVERVWDACVRMLETKCDSRQRPPS